MNKLFSASLLSIGGWLLTLLLIAKVIALGAWWYLPSESVELNNKQSYRVPYQRITFRNMLPVNKQKKAPPKKKKRQNLQNINNMVLHGLYGKGNYGFAIIAKKGSKKTTIVSVGELFGGYKLVAIHLDNVVFEKNHKTYRLALAKPKSKKSTSSYVKNKHTQTQEKKEYGIQKQDIEYYSKNPSKIWRDISISEVRKGKKITGFKVRKIRKNSKMASIGLKVGDVIIRANNVELKSYRDAMKLYNDIDKIDTLELVVLRNNQEKEIVYEIR